EPRVRSALVERLGPHPVGGVGLPQELHPPVAEPPVLAQRGAHRLARPVLAEVLHRDHEQLSMGEVEAPQLHDHRQRRRSPKRCKAARLRMSREPLPSGVRPSVRMLAELLAAASLAVGSMAAKTMAPPKAGPVVAKDKLAFGRIAELLTGIATRLREAASADDVPWLISSKVFDRVPRAHRRVGGLARVDRSR